MTDRARLYRQLVDAGLARMAENIAQLARPCIPIGTTPSDDSTLPVGASKFGGLADVPLHFSWPHWNDQPLAFLGQINLAAIAKNAMAAPLPSRGLLSFFYDREQSTWGFDPNDKGSWRVYLFPNDSLRRTAPPMPVPEAIGYAACGLSFDEGLTLPGWESLYLPRLNLTDVERDRYCKFDADEASDKGGHQLLGHPKEIQGDTQLECQLATNSLHDRCPEIYQTPCCELESLASQWMLLFQCDSDDNVGWMWGDGGRLYFWIMEADLKIRRFDRVWMILQCG